MSSLRVFGDPGPCPVDDYPHTTCTSHGPSARIVIDQLPCQAAALALERAAEMAVGRPLAPTEFTTTSYRRKARRG